MPSVPKPKRAPKSKPAPATPPSDLPPIPVMEFQIHQEIPLGNQQLLDVVMFGMERMLMVKAAEEGLHWHMEEHPETDELRIVATLRVVAPSAPMLPRNGAPTVPSGGTPTIIN